MSRQGFFLHIIAAGCLLFQAACGAGNRLEALDEFQSVGKAPLTLPPDYGLRPPGQGESRPRELSPEEQARVALFGKDIGRTASEGERLFVAAAGATNIPAVIRSLLDYESASLTRENAALTRDILVSAGMTGGDAALDPEAEEKRLEAGREAIERVTGGKPVIIRRETVKEKLPGL